MKKILYLLDNNINTIGGSQKSVKTIINEMHYMGYKVGIFMPVGDNNIVDNADYIYTYSKKNNKILLYIKETYELMKSERKYKPDIIHAHNPRIGMILGFLKKVGYLKNKCILTDRGYYTGYSKMYQLLYKHISNSFDLVTTTSFRNLNLWKKKAGLKKGICITNVLDNEWFDYSITKENRIKEKYGIIEKINIGFSARFEEYKRWDTVYEICKKMKNDDRFIFTIAITANNELYRNKMDVFINNLIKIMNDKLIVFKDADIKKMEEFYYMIDVFVLTSDQESFGRTILEAMTKNNVVYGTNSGGVPDIIKDRDYLFEVGETDEVICKIYKILSLDCLDDIKRNNRERVFKEYNKEILKIKLNGIYTEI